MKRKILGYTLFGAPTGLALWALFTLIMAFLRGDGEYNVVSYHLIRTYGSEVNAVAAQYVGAMLCGVIWANATLIWQETDWSLLKQTVVHWLVCTLPALLIAFVMRWMPRSVDGFMQYAMLFGGIYVLNWVCQYCSIKRRILQINARLDNMRDGA